MKKEIKDIAKMVIKELDGNTDGTFYTDDIATALYEVGYRKQSDTIKEFVEKIVEDLEEAIESNIKGCSEAMKNGEPETYNYCLGKRFACRGIIDLINELKKEYGAEE